MQTPKRQGVPWPMILLFASFLVPAAIAWTLFFTGWRPGSTGNHGDLLNPPHRLQGQLTDAAGAAVDPEHFRGRWTILLRSTGPCTADCQQRLVQTSQARQALAQHRDRVQRVLILPEGAPLPDEALLAAQGNDLAVYRTGDALLPAGSPHSDMPLHVSLMDSRGFRMMAYPEPLDAGGLLQDMKKLLKISNIDLERLQGLTEDN